MQPHTTDPDQALHTKLSRMCRSQSHTCCQHKADSDKEWFGLCIEGWDPSLHPMLIRVMVQGVAVREGLPCAASRGMCR